MYNDYNKRKHPRSKFIIVMLTIIAFIAGFCVHSFTGIKRSEYNSLILYNDLLSQKVTELEQRINALENPVKETDIVKKTDDDKGTTEGNSNNISEYVWITKSGKKYHKQDCGVLKEDGEKITLEQANELDKEPCKLCYK